ETLVVMSSKSFSTQETLQNTLTAKAWFLGEGGKQEDIAKHFVAVSSNVKAATEFGIAEENIFPMWDWVGGRYSLWSAIGLPISLALGFENFKGLLEGAHEMDKHFCTAPFESNLPVILATLGVWYRNFFDAQSHVMLPYYHYLRGLPAYVQQLDMESNGKSVTQDGRAVNHATGPIIWGATGTNGQHSFFQLLHQGSHFIPVDFIAVVKDGMSAPEHHRVLLANMPAQSCAPLSGKHSEEPCRNYPGNKPSNVILLEQLDAKTLGALIALYEHKIFCQGIILEICSFDQWGVELGKGLASKIEAELFDDEVSHPHDSSTNGLIAYYKTHRKQ
ncbi:glucose-6-phosphate isomerase, partial [uncultured Pseudoalteromonas sp.]|uniref:glucose-6-phosphate isomerase n=1 Tax=uncultured Pseudoalteromonas sp. TaxID=114053 RepID=UPI002616484D